MNWPVTPDYGDIRPCPRCGTAPTARSDGERCSVVSCPDCDVAPTIPHDPGGD